jgi:hypothetical protein
LAPTRPIPPHFSHKILSVNSGEASWHDENRFRVLAADVLRLPNTRAANPRKTRCRARVSLTIACTAMLTKRVWLQARQRRGLAQGAAVSDMHVDESAPRVPSRGLMSEHLDQPERRSPGRDILVNPVAVLLTCFGFPMRFSCWLQTRLPAADVPW